MKVQLFEIYFDDAYTNPQAVYWSGQVISFRVHIVLAAPVKCQSLEVKLYGSSKVHFEKGFKSSRKSYKSKEIYLNQIMRTFVPPPSGPQAGYHPAGEYFYPLSCPLHGSFPSSYEGVHGKIRYWIVAKLERPWKVERGVKKFFTVIRDLDLNQRPLDVVGPFETGDGTERNVCMATTCCCCMWNCFACGDITLSLSLAKRGYVPGEEIRIYGEIFNGICTRVKRVSVQLRQLTLCNARSGISKLHEAGNIRVAAAIELPGISQGQRLRLNHRLTVPPAVPSFIDGCNNIEVYYVLHFVARNCAGTRIASLSASQIVIGTVPLVLSQQSPSAPSGSAAPSAPSGSAAPSAPISPPPSYAECFFTRQESVKGSNARKGHNEESQWAPSYPVFESSV